MANISFYGSHNAALVVEDQGEILTVIEIERFNSYKNSGVAQFKVPANPFELMKQIMQFIKVRYGIDRFDNCLALNVDSIWGTEKIWFDEFIPAANYIRHGIRHHECHAANAFYQSPYREAIAFSFDGGGNDGFFNVFHCERETGIRLLQNFPYDFGVPYMIFGQYLQDIKMENSLGDGNLIYPGKIMGLVSYGTVQDQWLEDFKWFYKAGVTGVNFTTFITELGERTGIDFNSGRLQGELAWNVAATSQRAFEDCFLEIAQPFFDTYPDLPVLIAGGCGLNILLNTRVKTELKKEVFVGPSPNDCGIATGMMLNYLKPQEPPVLTYSGLPILDESCLARYFHHRHEALDLNRLVDYFLSGKIVGVVRGNSEHGPRALGNRSILCNPSFPEMKDTLNRKVKHREWYRPFAPVCRLEDVSTFFEFEGESTHMTFAPRVREAWRESLAAITHVDHTARIQTVTRSQNAFLYDLLTEMHNRNGIGVLLNTSFNVDGQPILTTIEDAYKVYWQSEMDFLLINDTLFKKI